MGTDGGSDEAVFDSATALAGQMPFVGRRTELGHLSQRLTRAVEGIPQLLVVRGEAGIGKSRLAREAASTDTHPVVVRFREGDSDPLQAFRSGLFSLLDNFAGSDAYDNGRKAAPPQPLSSSGADQAWVLSLTQELTVAFASQRPLLIIVDDLQWASPQAAALVEQVWTSAIDAALARPVRLMMVTTVRPNTPPHVATAMDRMLREPTAAAMDLAGLPDLDVAAMALNAGQPNLDQRGLTKLVTATGGNPLFIQAVLRDAQSGASGRLTGVVPDLEHTLAVSLERLEPQARSLVELASCLPEVDQPLLAAALGVSAAETHELLEQTEAAGVMARSGTTWDFAHGHFRRVAYHQLTANACRDLHQRLATALATLNAPDPRRQVHHLVLADAPFAGAAGAAILKQAMEAEWSNGNWAATVDLGRRLMDHPDNREDAHTSYVVAQALVIAGSRDEGFAVLDGAAEQAEDQGDLKLLADIVVFRCQAVVGGGQPGEVFDGDQLRQVIDRLDEADAPHLAMALAELSQVEWMGRRTDDAVISAQAAIDLVGAGTHPPAEVLARLTLSAVGWERFDLKGSTQQLQLAKELAPQSGAPQLEVGPVNRLPLNLAWSGQFDEAEDAAREAMEIGKSVRYAREYGLPLTALAMVALGRGNVVNAINHLEQSENVAQVTGYSWSTTFALPPMSVSYDAVGNHAEAEAVIKRLVDMMGPTSSWTMATSVLHQACRLQAGLGVNIDAPGMSHQIDPATARASLGTSALAAATVEYAQVSNNPPASVEGCLMILEESLERGLVYIGGAGIMTQRALGLARVLNGDTQPGIADLQAALHMSKDLGARLEEARAARDLMWTLEQLDDRANDATIRSLLERHDQLAQALNVQQVPVLDRAPLSTQANPESSDGERFQIVGFVDVVGSTALAHKLSPTAYAHRIRRVLSVLYREAHLTNGRVLNHTGDGALVVFDFANDAVAFAKACHREVSHADIRLSAGFHAGPTVELDGNIFGAAVNVAARVCSLANVDQTLLSQKVVAMLNPPIVGLVSQGCPPLPGVDEPPEIFLVL